MVLEAVNIKPAGAFRGLRGLDLPFVLSGGTARSRYSYVSADPFITVKTEGGSTTIGGEWKGQKEFGDPFSALSRLLPEFSYPEAPPFPFSSGMAGYFSYDLKKLIEPGLKVKGDNKEDLLLPDCLLGFYDPVFVYDHLKGEGYLVSINPGKGDSGKARFERFKKRLSAERPCSYDVSVATALTSNFTRADYIASIQKAKEYISAGDIYQINLSQRLKISWEGDPFALFLKLMEARPAPFSSFFDCGSFQIISNSPERLLKIENGYAETEPIKGTRPRGVTPEQDCLYRHELKMNIKEKAEHVMIVDLERNDLGRISVTGTVEVLGFEEVTTYPTLHHMASVVKGRLRPEVTPPAALRSIFPGGSVTGAPKIRAMEIIDELERVRRGVYTGGIGWIDSKGNADIAMAIRTAVYKDGSVYLHVGGGIVADSIPQDEYEETILKAKDFLDVLGMGGIEGLRGLGALVK
ncbi:MAG: aminodeoxychorismate synthase component I [Deltaproteobacteria bacterium]|nr:aminodeoxychorismate synthase component I [Deltaproteobacteria bacterium]